MNEIYKNLELENLENEIWLPIEGYENYQVSNMGRVKSLNYLHTKQEKILRQTKDKDGYLMVNLCKDGKKKTCKVHRLVAQAFIDNPNKLPQVNHKNEIKTDNRVENIECCNAKYNQNYGTCQQRRVENIDYKAIGRKNAAKLTNRQDLSKQVYQYTLEGTLVAIYPSVAECSRNGYNQGHVAACCRGEAKSHKGYIWSYTEL